MELRNLRYFWTVAEEGSISKAASELSITQPTLSRQLKKLEMELSVELFKRDQKGLILTPEGIFLKNRAEEILALTNKTQQEFEHKKNKIISGNISIGCVEADNSDTLSMILEELIKDYPLVTFHINSGTSDEITNKLDQGLIDIAILLEPISVDKYEKISLPRSERWGLLVSRDSDLAQNEYIVPGDLRKTRLMISGREEVQKMISNWCQFDVSGLKIVGTYNLIFNTFSLVENGVGSAVVIEGAIANRKAEEYLKFIPLQPELQTHCVLAWKRNRILTSLLEEFIKRFREMAN
ncbi:LysR family transcriptional regulator [Salinicoccus carnicancri]|uniref:LysR family transcriptional regulator n=1 Tax=Salinicoccus carnicancri TaxID=558170 RepID=UPI0002F108B0|nr:LysR family transcriptional regulator [Salinicoccus carnicancri]